MTTRRLSERRRRGRQTVRELVQAANRRGIIPSSAVIAAAVNKAGGNVSAEAVTALLADTRNGVEMTTAQVAAFLGVSRGRVAQLRCTGGFPEPIETRGRVNLYDEGEVTAWWSSQGHLHLKAPRELLRQAMGAHTDPRDRAALIALNKARHGFASWRDLAEAVGVHEETVRRWRNAEQRIGGRHLTRIRELCDETGAGND